MLVGRCVPYGEGITYWPLTEIIDQVAGRDPAGIAELVAGTESAELIAERIAGAVGLVEAEGRSEEIAWAVRKLFEALSRESPLVVVLDDIHWAEPTFLDLIEYLAGFTAGRFFSSLSPDPTSSTSGRRGRCPGRTRAPFSSSRCPRAKLRN